MECNNGKFLVDSEGNSYFSADGQPKATPAGAVKKDQPAAGGNANAAKGNDKKADKAAAKAAKQAAAKAEAAKAEPVAAPKEEVKLTGDHKLSTVENTEAYLKSNGIAFNTVRHPITMTNAEMIEAVKFTGEHKNAILAKQLFLHDKKKKENMWLVCAAVDTEVDMKLLSKKFGVGSGNLRGADLESLFKYLGCAKGLVNYYAIVNDVSNSVKVIMDKRLVDAEWASFHPMDNTGSTCINKEGIMKLKSLTNRDDTNFEIMDFGGGGAGAASTAPAQKKEYAPKIEKKEQPGKMTNE